MQLAEPQVLSGHAIGVAALAYSPDGKLLVSSGTVTPDNQGDLRVWNVEQKRVVRLMQTATGSIVELAFSPEGRHVASANSDGTIHILRVSEPK